MSSILSIRGTQLFVEQYNGKFKSLRVIALDHSHFRVFGPLVQEVNCIEGENSG